MPSNVQAEAVVTPGAGFVTVKITFDGDASQNLPGCFSGIISGTEDAYTFTLHPGGAGAVTAGTPRVTLASDDPAVTALQILDNIVAGSEAQVDVVSLPAIPAGTNNIGDVDVLTLPALPTGTNSIGTVVDGGSGKTLKRAVVSKTADGDIVALVATKKIKVYAYEIQSKTAGMTCQIKSNNAAGTALTVPWANDAREGVMGSAVQPPAFLFATVAGEALFADITGTGTVDIAVSYWDDDAV